jgi:hypothetical protein
MLPLYSKDVYAYTHAPASTIWHKANPIIGLVYELSKNKDYYGTGIVNPEDPTAKKIGDLGSYLASALLPFSIRGAEQNIGEEVTPSRVLEPAIGIMPAPKYFSQTKAMQKAIELGSEKLPVGGRTHEEADRNRLVNQYVKQYKMAEARGENTDPVTDQIQADLEEGKLKRQDLMHFKTKLTKDSLVETTKRLSMPQALTIWKLANDEEKRKIASIVIRKFRNLKDRSDKEKFAPDIDRISDELSRIYSTE